MKSFRAAACAATLLSAISLLPGCQQAPNRVATGQERVPSTAPAARPDPLIQGLSEGMGYSDARRLILNEGWTPVVDPDCMANVVGTDYKSACAAHPARDDCTSCKNLPELSSCSGDAYCGMYFSKGSQRLHVVAFGDMRDWNVRGDRSQFSVTGWDFERN